MKIIYYLYVEGLTLSYLKIPETLIKFDDDKLLSAEIDKLFFLSRLIICFYFLRKKCIYLNI